MKTYKVLLNRDYIVNIDAKNKEEAMSLTEFFIAGEKDASTEKESLLRRASTKAGEQYSFRINEIEMATNDAFEVEEIGN